VKRFVSFGCCLAGMFPIGCQKHKTLFINAFVLGAKLDISRYWKVFPTVYSRDDAFMGLLLAATAGICWPPHYAFVACFGFPIREKEANGSSL
jgi:hypothetical protein